MKLTMKKFQSLLTPIRGKIFHQFAFMLFVLIIGVAADQPLTVNKHALIVAIGDYPEETDWTVINSANDIVLIKQALEKQGFTRFIVIQDEEADKTGIIKAFAELKSGVEPGDIVAVHFSSHGQQIYDDNADEVDGKDEAIVAYGAPAYYDAGYKGENHLRDEELGALLDEIRLVSGPKGDVLVFLDACHSGTGTRGGGAVARGGKPPLMPPGSNTSGGSEEVGIFDSKRLTGTMDESKMASMVVISAARSDELNYEYDGCGSLSRAINASLTHLSPQTSYRSWFARITKEMSVYAPNQTPAMEGDIDRLLFGGRAIKQQPYYTVESIDGDAVVINGGTLTGVNEGTVVAFYPSGTVSTKGLNTSITGKVTFADAFTSTVILSEPTDEPVKGLWAFVRVKSFGDIHVTINGEGLRSKKLKNSFQDWLTEFQLAKSMESDPDFRLNSEGDSIILTNNRMEKRVAAWHKNALNYSDVENTLTKFAQGRFLKNLELVDTRYSIDLDLVPIRKSGGRIDTLDIATFLNNGIPAFRPGDQALMRIVNHSSVPVYITVIDIQPDGQVNPVIPNPYRGEDAEEFKVPAGRSWIVPRKRIGFGPPYGMETFKIFCSRYPLNFAPVLMTRGEPKGEPKNPIDALFNQSYSLNRGVSIETFDTEAEAATFTYTFLIKKP
jgi:hypothetical protein